MVIRNSRGAAARAVFLAAAVFGCTTEPPRKELPPLPPPAPTLATEWSFDADQMEREGRTAEALGALESAVNDPRNGRDPHIRYRLARAYGAVGRHADAIPLYQRAIALGPKETYVKDHVYGDLAYSLFQEERYAEALELYRQARVEAPSNANFAIGQARAAFALGRNDEARNLVKEAFDISPGFALGYETLARVAYAEGRYAAAEFEFRRALEHNPQLVSAMDGRAEALLRLGRIEEAAELRAKIVYVRADKTYDTPFPERGAGR